MSNDEGKLQKAVQNGGTKIVCRWTVEDFLPSFQGRKKLRSEGFRFGPGKWHCLIKSTTDSANVTAAETVEVSLSGPSGFHRHFEGRISWKLSVPDIEDKIAEGTWGKEDGYCNYRLPIGLLQDVREFLQPNSSLEVLSELCVIPDASSAASDIALGGSASSQTKRQPGKPYDGKLQELVQKGGTKIVCCWTIEDFLPSLQKQDILWSERIRFGPSVWDLNIISTTGPSYVKVGEEVEVHLMGPWGLDPFFCGQISWKLSVLDFEDKSYEGVWKAKDGYECVYKLPIAPLRDIRRFLQPNSSLEVLCELCIVDDVSCQTETHPGTDVLARDLERLLSSGDASDATVRVKGEKDFPVHRNILGARTPVFLSMFRHQMSEKASGVVDIEDCEPDTFGHFLHYVYTGRVEDLRSENAIPLYHVADKYQVEELKLECLKHIRRGLSVESFCPTLTLALTYSEKELAQLAKDFFVENAEEITLTVEWQRFLCENPIQANELIMKMFQITREKTTSSKETK